MSVVNCCALKAHFYSELMIYESKLDLLVDENNQPDDKLTFYVLQDDLMDNYQSFVKFVNSLRKVVENCLLSLLRDNLWACLLMMY